MLGFPAGPCARRRCSEPRAGGRRYGGGRHRVTLKLRRTGRTPMPDDVSGPNRFARALFGPLPARYDRLAEILSFGQNGRWRSAMVDRVLPAAGNGPRSEPRSEPGSEAGSAPGNGQREVLDV